VVVSGAVEILAPATGEGLVITRYGAGRFLGELNLLTGMRVVRLSPSGEPCEVIVVPSVALQRVIAMSRRLSDRILAGFMSRCSALMSGAASSTVRVLGSLGSRLSCSASGSSWPVAGSPTTGSIQTATPPSM
jgi:thioredoxin reductase (NADPH)